MKTATLLLVEDNDVDIEAIKRAFEKNRIGNPLVVTRNGREALDHLEAGTASPYLVLLDLNMPVMDGFEFLTELRASPRLRKTVVFVLTTSKREEDIVASYDKNVAGYIPKDAVGDEFFNLINMLEHYWRVVELPVETPG